MRYRLFLKLTAPAAALSALVLLAGTACGGRKSSEDAEDNGGTGANDTGGASQSGGSSAGGSSAGGSSAGGSSAGGSSAGGSSAGTSGRANIAGDSATGGTPSFGGSSETGGKSNGGASGMGGSSAGSSGSGGEGGASPVPDAECADLGGLCTPIGDCLSAGDHFAAEDPCAGPEQACCVPSAACGGPEETIKCCEGGATYRPACDNGEFVCVVGEPHDLNFNCGE